MPPVLQMTAEELSAGLRGGTVTVLVVGLGRMGLPTACLYAEAGCRVVGADSDPAVVDNVARGSAPADEPGLDTALRRGIDSKRLTVTPSVEEGAAGADVAILVVPTGIDAEGKPDYAALEDAARQVGRKLKAGGLVIVESTCGPGVTRRVVLPALEGEAKGRVGTDCGLAYAPIRAMTGRALSDLRGYPRVVGAFDERSLAAAEAVVSLLTSGGVVRVSSMETAEAAKLIEGVYRDTNIALANELAAACERFGVDYYEARSAANSQPHSSLHLPGVGVGGHCLPSYSYMLSAEQPGDDRRDDLVMTARRINDRMPVHVAGLVSKGLAACGKSFKKGAKIALFGITYRPDVREIRLSPAVALYHVLRAHGATVTIYDPNYSGGELTARGLSAADDARSAADDADVVVLAVAHSAFSAIPLSELASAMHKPAALVDCTGTLQPAAVEASGLKYFGLGRGTRKA